MENEIKALTDAINRFTEERDWDQFHNPKDLATLLNVKKKLSVNQFNVLPLPCFRIVNILYCMENIIPSK